MHLSVLVATSSPLRGEWKYLLPPEPSDKIDAAFELSCSNAVLGKTTGR